MPPQLWLLFHRSYFMIAASFWRFLHRTWLQRKGSSSHNCIPWNIQKEEVCCPTICKNPQLFFQKKANSLVLRTLHAFLTKIFACFMQVWPLFSTFSHTGSFSFFLFAIDFFLQKLLGFFGGQTTNQSRFHAAALKLSILNWLSRMQEYLVNTIYRAERFVEHLNFFLHLNYFRQGEKWLTRAR